MSLKVTQYLTLAISLVGTLGVPALATNWLHTHLLAYSIVVAVAIFMHAVFPSIFSAPSDADKQATNLTKVGMILLALAIFASAPGTLFAQSAVASTSNGFVASSDAVAVYYGGTWSAGTHVTESFDFLDFGATKANHVYLEGHELIAPTPGWSIYAGGLKIEPNLAGVLKKTNVPAGNFGVFFDAALGNGVPSSGGSHVSLLAGGGVKYQLTQSLTWQSLQAQYGQLGNSRFGAISTGLSFIFGKS